MEFRLPLAPQDVQDAVEDEEHLVLLFVGVPGDLVPFRPDEFDLLSVEIGHDLGGKSLRKPRESRLDVDLSNIHVTPPHPAFR